MVECILQRCCAVGLNLKPRSWKVKVLIRRRNHTWVFCLLVALDWRRLRIWTIFEGPVVYQCNKTKQKQNCDPIESDKSDDYKGMLETKARVSISNRAFSPLDYIRENTKLFIGIFAIMAWSWNLSMLRVSVVDDISQMYLYTFS